MAELLQKFQPQIWSGIQQLDPQFSNIREVYQNLPSISIDFAVMEKLNAESLACVPCDPGWSDVGSWDAVAEVYAANGEKPTVAVEVDSKNNFLMGYGKKKYALVGVDNLVVVDTGDALLISQRGKSQEVKTAVERLKKESSKVTTDHLFEERPWGSFEILREEDHFKSKVIQIDVGAQISYQSHSKREEHWIVLAGSGVVILDGKEIPVKQGSYVKIPFHSQHRIRNNGTQKLEFLEVQLGTYFGEDDIVRYQDDYDRAGGASPALVKKK